MNLLVADDHDLVREGIRISLEKLNNHSRIFEASNASQVMQHLNSENNFDLVLLDLHMPGTNDFELLSTITRTYPDINVLVISATEDKAKMRKAIDIGASGFITKSAPKDIMLSAIDLVIKGGVYIPPDLFSKNQEKNEFEEPEDNDSELYERFSPRIEQLTNRQKQVLMMLGRGLSNKGIANELDLSENTIKIHMSSIFRALNIRNRTQAGILGRMLLKKTSSE